MPLYSSQYPVGLMMEVITPTNGDWLACDGSQVSRITYAQLFLAIGTTYGPGDGANTFNLPLQPTYVIRAMP